MDAEGEVGIVEGEKNDVKDGVEVGGEVGRVIGWAGDGWEIFVFDF